jgi:hypothetical protein
MISRALFPIVFVIFLPACTIVDGYVQSTGAKIGYGKADELKNGVRKDHSFATKLSTAAFAFER